MKVEKSFFEKNKKEIKKIVLIAFLIMLIYVGLTNFKEMWNIFLKTLRIYKTIYTSSNIVLPPIYSNKIFRRKINK